MSYILHCERVAGGTRSPATLQRLPSMSSQGSVEEIFSLQASLDLTPDCFEQLRAEGALVPRMHAELEAFCCHQISALLELMEGWDGEVSFESTHGSALSKL
ncbi:unnamed protein product [Sphagnum troendelagicum]